MPLSRTSAEAWLHASPMRIPKGGMGSVARLPSLSRMYVCVALLPSSLDLACQIGWSSCPRERGGVCRTTGGEREIDKPCDNYYTAWHESLFLFECPIPSMHADKLPHHSLIRHCWPCPSLGARVDRMSQAACLHTARHPICYRWLGSD